jgi:hypothetical protein
MYITHLLSNEFQCVTDDLIHHKNLTCKTFNKKFHIDISTGIINSNYKIRYQWLLSHQKHQNLYKVMTNNSAFMTIKIAVQKKWQKMKTNLYF